MPYFPHIKDVRIVNIVELTTKKLGVMNVITVIPTLLFSCSVMPDPL